MRQEEAGGRRRGNVYRVHYGKTYWRRLKGEGRKEKGEGREVRRRTFIRERDILLDY